MRVRAPPLLDLIVPVRCVACTAEGALFCTACRASLRRLVPPLCARCGASTAWPVERCGECSGRRTPFRTARSAVAYDPVVRIFVAAWKERGLRRLGDLAVEFVVATVPRPEVHAVTHIPADHDRTLWRGTNTAESLATALAAQWELPLVRPLRRSRRVDRQRGLSRSARSANVRGAFEAVSRVPARLALVDDVYTTGSTVAAAATELRRAGARAVDVVTFARAIRA